MENVVQTDVCIVGGGPAGMILGLLLAKRGVDVLVLEKNINFDREYRGEIMHPQFVQMMEQIGLRSFLEQYPHLKIEDAGLYYKNKLIYPINFAALVPKLPYAFWMPQPILLDALHDKGKTYPTFQLWFHASVRELLREEKRIVGVRAKTDQGTVDIRAKVTVGADGRFSTVRKLGDFEMEYEHYKNDLAWFTATPEDVPKTFQLLMTDSRSYIVLPKYPNSIQGGITFKRGEWKKIQERGIDEIRKELVQASMMFKDFAYSLKDFNQFTLLQAKTMFVREWAKNGCLLIGDAAHCASPAAGIGVSLSTATAIVAAEVIYDAIQTGDVSVKQLSKVQEIRSKDIRNAHQMQLMQEAIQISTNPFIIRTRPYLISLLSKIPIFRAKQRGFFSMSNPLPISPEFNLS